MHLAISVSQRNTNRAIRITPENAPLKGEKTYTPTGENTYTPPGKKAVPLPAKKPEVIIQENTTSNNKACDKSPAVKKPERKLSEEELEYRRYLTDLFQRVYLGEHKEKLIFDGKEIKAIDLIRKSIPREVVVKKINIMVEKFRKAVKGSWEYGWTITPSMFWAVKNKLV